MIIKKKYNQSNRHFKVTENIKKSISEILLRNELPIESSLNFPLTVIEVKMSDDIRPVSYTHLTLPTNVAV